jgi:hypothetical protein
MTFVRALIVGCAAALALAALPFPARGASALSAPALIAFQRTWPAILGYSATVTFFEQRGAQVQTTVLDYSFRKPSSTTVHIVKGRNAGVTLVWNGGNTVIAHRGSGLAAMFKKSYSLHDPIMTSIRGSSIDQISFAAIISHAQVTPGRVTQSPGPIIGGIPTSAVTLMPISPAGDTGLTREVVAISTPTRLPLRILGYAGPTLVRQLDFTNVKLEFARIR